MCVHHRLHIHVAVTLNIEYIHLIFVNIFIRQGATIEFCFWFAFKSFVLPTPHFVITCSPIRFSIWLFIGRCVGRKMKHNNPKRVRKDWICVVITPGLAKQPKESNNQARRRGISRRRRRRKREEKYYNQAQLVIELDNNTIWNFSSVSLLISILFRVHVRTSNTNYYFRSSPKSQEPRHTAHCTLHTCGVTR